MSDPVEFGASEVAALAQDEAAALRGAALSAGDSLGWLAHNSPRLPALLVAARALDLRVVPLNWRLSAAELADIAAHAGLQALWHDEACAELAHAVRQRVALPQPPAPGHRPGDRMLVYTSGTTGTPKGAIHTDAGMAANLDAAIAVQGLSAADRVLAVLPLFHVGGLCIQVLPALAAGARVRLHARFDPGAWLHDVAHWRPTTSLLVPAAMRALVEHPGWAGADLSSLRFVNSGSQVVPESLIEAFHARGVPVAQVYGSTETGPVSIALHPAEALARVGCCGRPAPGVQVRLDAAGQVWLKAPNLMRGYHREAAPAFDADGWYATGDLAEVAPDGQHRIVGRCKDLIISGGENVYPAEIENLLVGHPGVADAVVVGLPDARWGEVPVLVVQPAPGAAWDDAARAALQARLDARLARFKHPRRVVAWASLPRTALGKVQRAEVAARLAAEPRD
jgi:fatty-acyl-CoA synthase